MFCNSRLWFIFLFVLLIYGCESKKNNSTKIQAYELVSKNLTICEIIECKVIEHNEKIYNTNVLELTIINTDGTSEVRHYDIYTEKLEFTYGAGRNIVQIIGLDSFTNLNEIWLGMTPFINDYSFLGKLNALEVLVFQNIAFSEIDFLYEISTLRKLIFQSCSINNLKIDASKFPNLEYFEFTNSQLNQFPIIIQEKGNINAINIAYNRINDIPIEESTNILIIAVGNPIVAYTSNKNIIIGPGDDVYYLLPEEYRQYVR